MRRKSAKPLWRAFRPEDLMRAPAFALVNKKGHELFEEGSRETKDVFYVRLLENGPEIGEEVEGESGSFLVEIYAQRAGRTERLIKPRRAYVPYSEITLSPTKVMAAHPYMSLVPMSLKQGWLENYASCIYRRTKKCKDWIAVVTKQSSAYGGLQRTFLEPRGPSKASLSEGRLSIPGTRSIARGPTSIGQGSVIEFAHNRESKTQRKKVRLYGVVSALLDGSLAILGPWTSFDGIVGYAHKADPKTKLTHLGSPAVPLPMAPSSKKRRRRKR